MLSVIWSILKIIGIIILVVLGLLLAVLLLILFVPLRYEVKGGGKYGQECEKDFFLRVRFSWLLRFLTVRAQADTGGFGAKVKLLGIPVFRLGNAKRQKPVKARKGKAGKKQREREATGEDEKVHGEEPEIPVALPEDLKELDEPLTAQSLGESDSYSVEEKKEQVSLKTEEKRRKNVLFRMFEKIKRFFLILIKTVENILTGICNSIRRISEKVKKLAGNIGQIWDFLSDERNKEVFSFLLHEGGLLVRHVFPQKLSGNISFSLEDPAASGQILMILGVVYPVIQDRLQITPLFENKNYIGGNLSFKGRIRVFSLLIIVIKVWFDKRFKAFLERGKSLKRNLG